MPSNHLLVGPRPCVGQQPGTATNNDCSVLRRTSPNRAAIYVPMAPIASAFFGWLLLDEPLGGLFLVGLACAVAAPLLIALERRRRTE